jgi:flagellar biosynthesis protein FlhF
VKIAVAHGIARRVPVRLCSTGTQVVGAQEQIARYAAILGTPLVSFESFGSLLLAMKGEPWKGLTLIDTAGISPADHAELREAEAFFAARDNRPEIEKHLVLRADARSADMLNVLTRFAPLNPSRLLFTGLDETTNLVSLVDTLVRCGTPLSFTCAGQQIPDDLKAAKTEDAAHLAESVIALARRFETGSSEVRSRFAAAA